MSNEIVQAEAPAHQDGLLAQAMQGAAQGSGALARAMASRETASVLTAALVAKQFPRDEVLALTKIRRACNRPGLAASSAYSFNRGGQDVTGPTIRIAEAIAQAWGNIQFGWDELDRTIDAKKGIMVSKIKAYARDVESNTYVERMFDVPHWRDKKISQHNPLGGDALTSERDIYELCANQASRRVRACILAIIPGDIVDDAMFWCDETIKNKEKGRPIADRIRDMMVEYGQMGVTEEMLAAKLQHPTASMTEAEFRKLGKLFVGIRDGYTSVEKEFVKEAKTAAAPAEQPRQEAPAPKGRRTRQPAAPGPEDAPTSEAATAAAAPPEPPTSAALEDVRVEKFLKPLLAKCELNQITSDELMAWAVRQKINDIDPTKSLDGQPQDGLAEISAFFGDAVEDILSSR